jgi:hypothetical protein
MANVGVISLDCDELVVTASTMDRSSLLSDSDVIQLAAGLLSACDEGEGLRCDLNQTPLIREMRKSFTGESVHESSRGVLAACGSALHEERGRIEIVEEINRRLNSVRLFSDWNEEGLLALVSRGLGPWGGVGRLLWESQRLVRRGIPGGGRYRQSRVVGREEWRRLGVRRGSWVVFSTFCV